MFGCFATDSRHRSLRPAGGGGCLPDVLVPRQLLGARNGVHGFRDSDDRHPVPRHAASRRLARTERGLFWLRAQYDGVPVTSAVLQYYRDPGNSGQVRTGLLPLKKCWTSKHDTADAIERTLLSKGGKVAKGASVFSCDINHANREAFLLAFSLSSLPFFFFFCF